MTSINYRAPLLSNIKLCASFHCHMWIQTGVQKRLSGIMTSVTLTFDLWPWPFAWTSHLSLVITPENFRMIRWWEHSDKDVTDGQTDGRTDGQKCTRAAWSQLKKLWGYHNKFDSIKIFTFYWYVKIPQYGYMEHELEYINTIPPEIDLQFKWFVYCCF